MEEEFWHERWENNLIGFHLDEVNQYLIQSWPLLNLKAGATVFVPLCGKSRDITWLSEQGFNVIGIELSPLAVKSYFAENHLNVEKTHIGGIDCWQAGNIHIYCGNFFDMTAKILGKVDAVYDRASLIALPPAMRQDYARHLTKITAPAPKLLVTLEYEQDKMDGPPFSVTEEEVGALYQANYQIKQLSAQDVLGSNEKFRSRGLDYMKECTYLLEAKV